MPLCMFLITNPTDAQEDQHLGEAVRCRHVGQSCMTLCKYRDHVHQGLVYADCGRSEG